LNPGTKLFDEPNMTNSIQNIRHRTRTPWGTDAELAEQQAQRNRVAEERRAVNALVKRATRDVQKSLNKLHLIAGAENTEKLRLNLRLLFKSYNARIWAVEKAYRRVHGGVFLSMDTLTSLAQKINMWERPDERVHSYQKIKKDGGARMIMNFGVEARAQQYLLKAALEKTIRILENQFGVVGGRDEACTKIRSLISTEGYKFALVADIKNCFGSFSEEEVVKSLPLIKAIARAVVVTPPSELLTGSVWETGNRFQRTVRGVKGIPQGSAVSNLVAEVLLAPVFEKFKGRAVAIGYCDDILVLTKTRKEAEIARETLVSCLMQLPAGPLSLGSGEIRRISSGFEYLGYWFRTFKGRICLMPRPQQRQLFDLEAKLKEFDIMLGIENVNDLINKINGWHGSYRLWSDMEKSRRKYLTFAKISDRLGSLNRNECPPRSRRRRAATRH
jgi:Arc/MetJ family transcription regulator